MKPTNSTSKRKPYNHLAGYVASRHNLENGGWCVIYKAEDQGMDLEEKFVVICETHDNFIGENTMKNARISMKYPSNFCQDCRDLLSKQG